MRFAGYAALFDKRDAGRDTIRPGAFTRTLAERKDWGRADRVADRVPAAAA